MLTYMYFCGYQPFAVRLYVLFGLAQEGFVPCSPPSLCGAQPPAHPAPAALLDDGGASTIIGVGRPAEDEAAACGPAGCTGGGDM